MPELPRHLAIIMDGNGRWAETHGRRRVFGHVRGAQVAREVISQCAELGIKYLTLYAFSTENWLRPKAEVNTLMRLLEKYLRKERNTLMRQNIKFGCIGDISKLPKSTLHEIKTTITSTVDNTGLHLIFALNYGGRLEITSVCMKIAEDIHAGRLQPSDVSPSLIESYLHTTGLPDPDLIIRTSGEFRISNFLLWQSAYSEYYIASTLWPDFSREQLLVALQDYKRRHRRFGKIPSISTSKLSVEQV